LLVSVVAVSFAVILAAIVYSAVSRTRRAEQIAQYAAATEPAARAILASIAPPEPTSAPVAPVTRAAPPVASHRPEPPSHRPFTRPVDGLPGVTVWVRVGDYIPVLGHFSG